MGDIESVERFPRRRFTKRLPGLKNMSLNQRFKFLDVPSLELRRLRADLYWCYQGRMSLFVTLTAVSMLIGIFLIGKFCFFSVPI